jgi:hypothetical protein
MFKNIKNANFVVFYRLLLYLHTNKLLIYTIMGAGRPFKYTVDELRKLFEEYKVYRRNQYDIRYEAIKSGERAGEVIEVKLPKVLTIASFCLYIGTNEKSFYQWLHEDSENIDKELSKFISCVQDEIKDHQLSGATNNIYNSNIVARMNGLSDKQQIEHTGESQAVNINIDGSKLDLTR